MKNQPWAPRRRLYLPLVAAAFAGRLVAQDSSSVPLPSYIVSATRTAVDPKSVPSAVTVLDPGELALSQIADLGGALDQVPGLSVMQTGAVGGPTSVFIRGGTSDHTLFLVDGIRLNTADASYTNFLGGADLAGVDRIEVLRGAQSTLYGSSAIGGVIVLNTAFGRDPGSRVVSGEGGSFSTYRGAIEARGATDRLGYSLSLSGQSTDNDREFNAFDELSYSARLEARPTATTVLGLTWRGQDSSAEAPGSVGSNFVGTVDALTNLSTAYGEWKPTAQFRSRLTYGWFQQEYTYLPEPPPLGNAFDSPYYSRDTRNVFDWQTTWEPEDRISLVGGVNVESERVTTDTPGASEQFDNDSQAAFLLANWHPVENATLLAGVRYDDFDHFGSATTWKAGASYFIPTSGTKLRANYGTGFAAPRPVYIVGGPFYNPNPGLEPEKSESWDLGIDQSWWKDRMTVSATYFDNRFRNLFIYDFSIPGILNTGRASAHGVEFSLDLAPVKELDFRLAYTYLDASNDSSGVPLIRRPGDQIDAEVKWAATPAWRLGAGVHVAASRYDGSATAPAPVEDYTVVRFFTQYQLPHGLLLKLRVENLLDENYAEVSGYPALPFAIYGGIDWHF